VSALTTANIHPEGYSVVCVRERERERERERGGRGVIVSRVEWWNRIPMFFMYIIYNLI